jgi:excisionase family DNA binding protein
MITESFMSRENAPDIEQSSGPVWPGLARLGADNAANDHVASENSFCANEHQQMSTIRPEVTGRRSSAAAADVEGEHRVVTVYEAAKTLRISRGAAYEAIRRREIPTIRIGRRLLVPVAALERMLDR